VIFSDATRRATGSATFAIISAVIDLKMICRANATFVESAAVFQKTYGGI
jgi:hypothetical protein